MALGEGTRVHPDRRGGGERGDRAELPDLAPGAGARARPAGGQLHRRQGRVHRLRRADWRQRQDPEPRQRLSWHDAGGWRVRRPARHLHQRQTPPRHQPRRHAQERRRLGGRADPGALRRVDGRGGDHRARRDDRALGAGRRRARSSPTTCPTMALSWQPGAAGRATPAPAATAWPMRATACEHRLLICPHCGREIVIGSGDWVGDGWSRGRGARWLHRHAYASDH